MICIVYCQNCGERATGEICNNCGQKIQMPIESNKQLPASKINKDIPSQNKLKLVIIITVAAVLILAVSLVLFLIPRESDGGPKEGLTVEMTATDTMKVNGNGEYTLNLSKIYREHIDEQHGNGDGIVSTEEVEDYEEAYEEKTGGTSSGYTINQLYGKTVQKRLRLTNAEGNVTSGGEITFSMSKTINWPTINVERDSYKIVISKYGMNINQFWFKSPPGYEIYSIYGLEEEIDPGRTTVMGIIDEGVSYLHITILKSGTSEGYESGDREPNDSMQTASSISDGDLITGTLNAQDDQEDYYYIYLQYADDIEINLTGSGFTDFDLRLYNPDGFQVAHSANEDSNEHIRHESFSSGVYYIKVDTFSGSGEYLLEVEVY